MHHTLTLLLFLKKPKTQFPKGFSVFVTRFRSAGQHWWPALVVSPGVVRDWVRVLSLNVCITDTSLTASLLVFSWIVVAAMKRGMRGFIACPSEGINHEYNRKGERLLKPLASLQEVTFDSIPGCSPKRSHI